MKKLLLAAALLLTTSPALAHATKPTDTVSVEASTYNEAGDTQTSHKLYSKPWGQIKLDKSTIQKIDKKIAFMQSILGSERNFRIVHLVIVDNEVQRALLIAETGTAVSIELESGIWCYISVAGQNALQASAACSK